jgi:hypothetical protein
MASGAPATPEPKISSIEFTPRQPKGRINDSIFQTVESFSSEIDVGVLQKLTSFECAKKYIMRTNRIEGLSFSNFHGISMMPTGERFRKNDAWFKTMQLTFDCSQAAEDENEKDRARMEEVVSIEKWYTSLKTKMVVLIRDLAIDFACPPLESKETSNQKHQRLYAAYRGWEAIHALHESHASQENSDSDSYGSYGSGGEEEEEEVEEEVEEVEEVEEEEKEEKEEKEDVIEDVNEDDVTDNFVKKMEIIATQLQKTNKELATTMRLEIDSFNRRRTQRSGGGGGGGGGGDEKLGDKGDNGDKGDKGEKIDQALNGTTDTGGGGGGDPFSKLFVALCLRF